MYKVINIDTLVHSGDTRHMIDELREGAPIRYEILSGGVDIGYVELSKETYRNKEAGEGYQIEIRWLYINEVNRGKGYMRKLVRKLMLIGLPLIGEIVELDKRNVWESVGAEFLNDWDFIIR